MEQARQDPVEQATATTELLASDNWESTAGTPWPGYCLTSENEESASYTYNLRTAQRFDGLYADAQQVFEYWESLGLSTRIVDHGGYPVVYATGGPVIRASFMTMTPDADEYEVGAVGKCVPGYDLDLQEEERQCRANREAIPSDNYFQNHSPDDTDQE